MEYTDEELAIVYDIYEGNRGERDAISAMLDADSTKWWDYVDQLKALNDRESAQIEKAIEEYRAGNTSNQTNFTSVDDQFEAPVKEEDDLDQLLEDTEKLTSPSSTSQTEDKPSFKVLLDLRKEGLDEIADNYWWGDGSKYDDYIAALPHGEQGPAQGPNTPVRRDGDMYVPSDFAPFPYRITPGMNYERRAEESPQNIDYSLATASSASDEQRQQQTFQSEYDPQKAKTAEYDPQKAKTAASAAKSYKVGSATEDPFRSQAAFG